MGCATSVTPAPRSKSRTHHKAGVSVDNDLTRMERFRTLATSVAQPGATLQELRAIAMSTKQYEVLLKDKEILLGQQERSVVRALEAEERALYVEMLAERERAAQQKLSKKDLSSTATSEVAPPEPNEPRQFNLLKHDPPQSVASSAAVGKQPSR
eukprot:gnl/Spiro4/2830_TR1384_c0_g1_i1.p1 gnl/Spiro4/2830_TR1384_c0_g1~~gnl/Spiro4/2830_TR1384_c0_g1_i1.p1  ORF type:complete len:155 (+),score=31.26 gnl/Spiro4/2830_TR1384_c0_g1_i1:82-546(+)